MNEVDKRVAALRAKIEARFGAGEILWAVVACDGCEASAPASQVAFTWHIGESGPPDYCAQCRKEYGR